MQVQALIANGIMRLAEADNIPEEDTTTEYAVAIYS
jgi:hypothetical protein